MTRLRSATANIQLPQLVLDVEDDHEKNFSEGSASTRLRIKSKAKKLLGKLVERYNEIFKGEGLELLEEVCDKIPIADQTPNCLKWLMISKSRYTKRVHLEKFSVSRIPDADVMTRYQKQR